MTSPIETMEWLDLQFRTRAKEDGEAHTAQDAEQVETARRAFGAMLTALRDIVSAFGGNVPGWLREEYAAAEAAIAAAEGGGATDAPKAQPTPADFEQRRDGWLIAFIPISSAARQWSIDATPKSARWEHERWYASRAHAPDVRRELEAEGFTVREV